MHHQAVDHHLRPQFFPYEYFPNGLKVLLVGIEDVTLTIAERELLNSYYHVTRCSSGSMALKLLQETTGYFDLVVSGDFLEDMGGYDFIRHQRLRTNVPHIIISGNERTDAIAGALKFDVCDYLIPPLNETVMRNIWQHVWRRKKQEEDSKLLYSNDNNINDQQIIIRRPQDEATTSLNATTTKRGTKDEDNSEPGNTGGPPLKKRRVVWSEDLHLKFVNAVKRLGNTRAVPKAILEMMGEPRLTRENVASHLQKYRMYMKRLEEQQHKYQQIPAGFAESSPGSFDDMKVALSHASVQPLSVLPPDHHWLVPPTNPNPPLLLEASRISPPQSFFTVEDVAQWSTHHRLPNQMQPPPESFSFGPIASLATPVSSPSTGSTSNMQRLDQTIASSPSYSMKPGDDALNPEKAIVRGHEFGNLEPDLSPNYSSSFDHLYMES